MKRMLKDWGVAIGLAVAVYLLIGWLQPSMDLPDQAPPISVDTLDSGPWLLESHRGKTVVLNFWATWCGPCKREIPDFSRFAEDHPEVPVIGISLDDQKISDARLRAQAKALGVRYPVARFTETIRADYDVRTLPTTVIVGPEGQVQFIRVGSMSYDSLVRAVGKVSG
jgi:thiol-disulfide isomerase/thioredoxin